MLSRLMIVTLLAVASSTATASADYVEIERPYSYVEPFGVTSSGVVLAMGSTDIANPNTTHVPFTWNGGFTQLPSPFSDALFTAVADINDQGRVAGSSGHTNPRSGCSSTQPVESRGLVWAGGGLLTQLDGLPYSGGPTACDYTPNSAPVALNGAGVVLGRSEGKTVTSAAGSSAVTPLPAACPTTSESAMAINDAGTVVLQCANAVRTVSALGVVTDLPVGFFAVARGITPSGVVLGRMNGLPAKVVGASSVTTLQPLPGSTTATASAIADDGTVVGSSGTGTGTRATLWRPDGTPVDLNTMAPGATGPLVSATDISPNGAYIIGRVTAGGGQTDAPIYRIGAGQDTLDVEVTASTPDGRALNTGDLTEQESFNVRVTRC